jgi:hypothetical protein
MERDRRIHLLRLLITKGMKVLRYFSVRAGIKQKKGKKKQITDTQKRTEWRGKEEEAFDGKGIEGTMSLPSLRAR